MRLKFHFLQCIEQHKGKNVLQWRFCKTSEKTLLSVRKILIQRIIFQTVKKVAELKNLEVLHEAKKMATVKFKN